MVPHWIEELANRGYRLYHPRDPDTPLTEAEMVMYLANYAQHLERQLNELSEQMGLRLSELIGA